MDRGGAGVRYAMILACALVATASCGGGSSGDAAGADGGAVLPDGGSTGGDSSLVFDESVIRTYELEVAETDWQWLNDNATLEQYVPATLNFEGDTYSQVGLRYKGGYGSLYSCFQGDTRICDKLSLKIKFNEYVAGARFYGLKRVNLHSMEADPTKMHDALSYRLFRDLGVPAPRTAYARVVVNGELLGLFAVIEQIDGRFTRRVFPDGGEGNLYKEIWPSHTTEQPYLDALKTNEDESPSADKMVRFAQALVDAGEEGFTDVIDSWMDRQTLMRYMAVARLIDSWDDIVAWYCVGAGPCFNHNYYWYESQSEDKVWLIAWDTDHTFEEPSPIRYHFGMPDWDDVDAPCTPIDIFAEIQGMPPACDPFIRNMATQLWDDYAAESQALLDGAFSVAAMTARIDALETLIEDAVAEDPNGPTLSTWRSSVDTLRTIVDSKRAHVMGKL